MTSPVLEPKAPRRRKKRSTLRRQRVVAVTVLCIVALLAIAFGVVKYITSRDVFEDPADGTKYYIRNEDGVYLMEDEDGNLLDKTTDGNYVTKAGTLVMINEETGEPKIVAVVDDVGGTEDLQFSAYNGEFDILIYPYLEREDIVSIELHNVEKVKDEKTGEVIEEVLHHFTFVQDGDDYEIKEYPDLAYDSNLFSTLVICTGYTNTYVRLNLDEIRENGEGDYRYSDYGLPEDMDDAVNYFVLTDKNGKSYKVALGDQTPPGTGYYVRYEGRDGYVYVLKELEKTTYSESLSTALFASAEDYIMPMVTVPTNQTNYFDVVGFELNKLQITEEMLKDPNLDAEQLIKDLSESVIKFSYTPIEVRRNTFMANIPYTGEGKFEGFGINSLKVDFCLQNIRDLTDATTVKLFTEEENKEGGLYFLQHYGLGFTMEFNLVTERDEKNGYAITESYHQQIYISRRTERGTYYMYNPAFSMIVEVGRASTEYLDLDAFDWIENTYINGNIVFLQGMEIFVPGGVTVDGVNRTEFNFVIDNSASIEDMEEDASSIPSDKMLVWESGNAVELMQFKTFYQSLLRSELGGTASCPEDWQEICRDAAKQEDYANDSVQPILVIKMTYNTKEDGSGDEVVRTYCFYPYKTGNYQSFATLNGNGSFYMVTRRVQKIINDLGRVFSGEVIDSTAKT